MKEEWRSIKDYPDYEISDMGRIRRCTDSNRSPSGTIIKPDTVMRDGYRTVRLWHNGKCFHLWVYRLVSNTFIGAIPPGYVRHHKDEDKTNDNLNNIEYVTQNSHRFFHNFGKRNPSAKLKIDQVHEIRKLRTTGIRLKQLSEIFDVSQQHISRIVNNQRWNNLSPGGARNLTPASEGISLHPCNTQDDRAINSELSANPGRHGCAHRYLRD